MASLDLAAARAYLIESLPDGEPVEIGDAEALDRAVAVVRGSTA